MKNRYQAAQMRVTKFKTILKNKDSLAKRGFMRKNTQNC